MKDNKNLLSSRPKIPFGVEIEINSFDLKSRPDNLALPPAGIYEVAFLVNKSSNDKVFVSKWCNNHDNLFWYVKPDSSCGIEICSPVLKGWYGIRKIFKVIDSLKEDKRIHADSRCSFHVHFDISSFSNSELFSIFSWWIKLESFFMDAMPSSRKANPYCRLIAQSKIVDNVAGNYDLKYFVERLGSIKYYTLNSYHYYHKNRKTIEFRIMDASCCLDPYQAAYWVSLLDHFINVAAFTGAPSSFKEGDAFSGLCWLDPIDAFKFLNFFSNDLCPRLSKIRSWLVHRLSLNCKNYLKFGVFSENIKKYSYKEVCELEKKFDEEICRSEKLFSDF